MGTVHGALAAAELDGLTGRVAPRRSRAGCQHRAWCQALVGVAPRLHVHRGQRVNVLRHGELASGDSRRVLVRRHGSFSMSSMKPIPG